MKTLIFMVVTGIFYSLFAQEAVGIIKNVSGEAHVIRADKQKVLAKAGDKFFEKDTIVTARGATAGLIFNDNTLVSVGSNSEFVVKEYVFKPGEKKASFVSEVTKGSIACMTGLISKMNPEAMKVKARTATIGIRGTYFVVEAD